MNIYNINGIFKRCLIFFWAIWWLIAFWTDFIGGLAHLGLVHATWAPDTNYGFLADSLKMYTTSTLLVTCFFLAILSWSFISSVAFIWASVAICLGRQWFKIATLAFVISLLFWMAFFLADQMVMKFDLEENHMVQGGFELLTFLTLYLLPDRKL